jgi:hypothetical protein
MKDRSKLPLWARAEISRLETNVAYWKGMALKAADTHTPDGTNVVLSDVDKIHGLPPNSIISFRQKNKHRIDVGFRDRGLLSVRSLDGLLIVRPLAGNSIDVESIDR